MKNISKHQQGQSAIEMLLVLPILLSLIFGVIQWGFVSQSKITINAATEQAARAGALNHGQMSAIKKGFAEGITPLFMETDASHTGIIKAYAKARLAANVRSQITILNPSSEVFRAFRQNVVYPKQNRRIWEIPNDNLMFRSSDVVNVSQGLEMNIQDANLLKIQVNWCQELIIPIIGDLIVNTVGGLNLSAQQARCNGVSVVTGKPMLAVQSIATYRMQTPFRWLM